ncbi:MAG: hypothetical protein AB7L09_13035 [Nitrospira sp.]
MRFRRVVNDKDHFDLLPVIAIFICLMGTLLLVTISVASLSIGPGAGEGWLPVKDLTTATKIPVLVEWDGTRARHHHENRVVMSEWHDWGESDGSPELRELVKDLQARSTTHYALFAVRPSGFHNFLVFVSKFREAGISVGYEPIAQNRPVKLLQSKRGTHEIYTPSQ